MAGKVTIGDCRCPPDGRRDRSVRLAALLAAVLMTGCAEDEERSQFDRFTGDIPPPETVPDAREDAGRRTFPNLSSVPDAPGEITPKSERSRLKVALAADRDRAAFTGPGGLPALWDPGANGDGPAAGRSERSEHVADIYFAGGSAVLSRDDRDVLAAVVRLHRTHGGIIRVVGHASGTAQTVDPVGDALSNFRLSMARANAVASGLESLGVFRARLVVEAQSDRQPIHRDPPREAAAGNQRAEVFLEY